MQIRHFSNTYPFRNNKENIISAIIKPTMKNISCLATNVPNIPIIDKKQNNNILFICCNLSVLNPKYCTNILVTTKHSAKTAMHSAIFHILTYHSSVEKYCIFLLPSLFSHDLVVCL